MCSNAVPQKLVADGGYDSQYNHELLREKYDIESLIPAVHGRPTAGLPTNRWRYLMATAFDEETYGQRWQVETVMFMLKRHQGAALTARSDPARRREMGLMAVTHNIMILYDHRAFLQGTLVPFNSPLCFPNLRIHVGNDAKDPHNLLELAEREAILTIDASHPAIARSNTIIGIVSIACSLPVRGVENIAREYDYLCTSKAKLSDVTPS